MIHVCTLAQGAEKHGQIVPSMSTRQRNLASMVAEHGYDAMATAAQRRSFEEEHMNVEPKTVGRRRRSEQMRGRTPVLTKRKPPADLLE